MAQRCPECGAPATGTPWCGACGAHLPARGTGLSSRAAGRSGAPEAGGGRAWSRRLTALLVLGALGSLLVRGGSAGPPPASDPPVDAVPDGEVLPPVLLDRSTAGRQFASRGSVLWRRTDLASPPRVEAVAPVGTGHVLVGRRLLSTGAARDADVSLPRAVVDGAFDDDGRWAVAEFDRVVLGDVTATVTTVIPDGWRPSGPAVAWHEGVPVLRDTAGHLALLAEDGTQRWRTAEPVAPTGPVGDRWVAGVGADDRPVVVALADGRVVDLPARALALRGDRAVTRPDAVVAVDLSTGATAWRRPATGATWRGLDAGFVAEQADAAVLVDPDTGDERGRVAGTDVVATDDVVVVRGTEGVEAVSWSGRSRWRLRLAVEARVLAVDATRVAVRVGPPAGARLTVLEASSGQVVADTVLPATDDRRLALAGDRLWLLGGEEPVAVVDRATGEDVAAGDEAPPDADDLRFPAGGTTVTVVAGAATLRGTDGVATRWTVPFGAALLRPPVRAGTSVLVLLTDGTVAALDPRTGEVRWRRDLPGLPTAAASDGTVLLVGTRDGEVLRLDPDGEVVTRTVVGSGAVEALAAGRPAAALLAGRLVGLDVDG